MSKKLLVVLLLCATVKAIAQTSGPFDQLDFSACETGRLLNLATRATLPVNPDTLKVLSFEESAHWMNVMHQTAISSSPIIPAWEQIRQTELRHISQGIVTITLAHFYYNYIRPNALINGDLTFADSVFQMTPGTDIYETGLFMAAHLSQDYWPEQTVKFMLDDELLFTDIESGPMTIEWDAGDGQGWRPLTTNNTIEIHYTDNSHHTILFRITDDEQGTKITGCTLKSGGCSSNYPMPVTPPWSSSNTGSYPFGISCQSDGINISGNAYYLPSGDFDKPFIFVEGIDFTPLQSAMQNGDFGWCQFTSGYESLDYPYSMISLMPKFLDSLRVRGYDVILVDFADGARSMNDNASLLIELIHLVNSFKTGDHPNVIAGASMGGQVCRYALKRMEELGQDHCCRLWISFDSPNTGAYVPIALQQVLDVLSNEPLASYAINEKLLSPAAKQLLMLQHFQGAGYVPGGTDDFQNWYSNLGYPSDCRKIAVTNGSLTGAYQKDQDGNTNSHYDHLLSYNCDALPCAPGPEARFFMTPSCGDPWYSDYNGNQSNGSSNVSAQVVLSEISYENATNGATVGGLFGGIISGALGAATGALCFPDQQITTYWSPASLPNYDYAPGGYSNSLVEIIEGVNEEGTLIGSGCPAISDDNGNLFHCFIPTASALGVSGVGLYDNLDEILDAHPELCPFDAFAGPVSFNQPHTHLSWENMRFLLDEITGGENAIGNPLIPDNLIGETFNYG
ncbi:MAG: esterase/lipase family protein, partial [Flavobacteriales bacterium]